MWKGGGDYKRKMWGLVQAQKVDMVKRLYRELPGIELKVAIWHGQ